LCDIGIAVQGFVLLGVVFIDIVTGRSEDPAHRWEESSEDMSWRLSRRIEPRWREEPGHWRRRLIVCASCENRFTAARDAVAKDGKFGRWLKY
jgi:hypothetical protein